MGEGGSSPPWTALQYQRFSIDPQPLQASVEGGKLKEKISSVNIKTNPKNTSSNLNAAI